MATHNDPRMYSAGAVTFNTQPSVNLYAQLLAKKQAREDALDEYEKSRMSRINDKGMRDQDREVLDKSLADTMGYYSANKKAIQKGGTPEAYNYEKMWRGNNDIVSESRDASARSDAFNKLRQERLKTGRATPEDWFTDYTAHEQPIRSEGYKQLDMAKYMSGVQPKYDQKKSMDLLKGIKLSDSPVRYEPIPGKPDLRNEIHEKRLDASALTSISHIAETEYDNDDAFASIVQAKVADPLKRGELESVFEKHFNTKPQGYPDYAIAEKLSQIQPSLTTVKAVADWPYRTATNQANSIKKIYANKPSSSANGANGNAFDSFGDAEYPKFNLKIKDGIFYNADGTPKNGKVFITGDVIPSSIKSALNSGGIDDKYLIGGVDATVKDGQIQSISNNLIGTVTRGTMEGVYQKKLDTEPLKGTPLKFNSGITPTISTGYKKSDLLKAGWTEDQIKQAVKAGKIKLN